MLSSRWMSHGWIQFILHVSQTTGYEEQLFMYCFQQRYKVDYELSSTFVLRFSNLRLFLSLALQRTSDFLEWTWKQLFSAESLKRTSSWRNQKDTKINAVLNFFAVSWGTPWFAASLKEMVGNPQHFSLWSGTSKHFTWPTYLGLDNRKRVHMIKFPGYDWLIAGRFLEAVNRLRFRLSRISEIGDCSEANVCLGLEVFRISKVRTKIAQANCENGTGTLWNEKCKAVSICIDHQIEIANLNDNPTSDNLCRQAIRSLIYLMKSKIPDICFDVGQLSQFSKQTTKSLQIAV